MIRLIAAIFCVAFAPAAIAAEEIPVSKEAYTAEVLGLNQIDPKQNPKYTLASRAMSFRLLDSNRRTMGKINDLTIGAEGNLESVQAEVMSVGFNQELSFDVVAYNVIPESDAYSMTLSRDQMENNLDEILAATASAAGDDSGTITVRSLIGARVQSPRSGQIAIVDDVMIDDQRKMAVAMILTLMGGTGQKTVAVPYREAKIMRSGRKATVELSDEQAKIVSSYAPKR